MLLKLVRDVAPYKIYQVVHILMLLWQQLGSSLLPLQNEILPFATQQGKIPGLLYDARQSHLHGVCSSTAIEL